MKSSLAQLSFLIVDDNANMSTIVKLILKAFGAIQIFEARDVADAFQIARQRSVDLAFVDYNLGFMDGVSFVKLMRTASDSPNPFLPIIMLTAYSEPSKVAAARDAGATEFCVKPITAAEVLRKISEVVERPRPFVRTAGFFGPCRRRREDATYTGPERRARAELPAREEASAA